MRLRPLVALAALPILGCGSGGSGGGPIMVDLPSVNVAAHSELLGMCQSFTLNNDEPIYVNRVVMTAGKAWHHSNWFFDPLSVADGPDGTWSCASRGFDEVVGGGQGGVLFAQSTQVSSETQAFPAGAVLTIPRHARVVGTIHLLNASTSPVDTSMQLELDPIPASQVAVHLRPMALEYVPLDIPPQARSEFQGDCDVVGMNGAPLDFSVYYVLPHYHYWGQGAFIDARYPGGKVGTQVFSGESAIGTPLGRTIDPPIDLHGASDLTFGCQYDNTTTQPLYWGNGGGEMCVFLAFTDSTYRWGGGVLDGAPNTVLGPDQNGVIQNSGPCQFYRF